MVFTRRAFEAGSILGLLLGAALSLGGCSERVVEQERELIVPPWLQGTWSSRIGGGDMETLQQIVFLDGGEVVHAAQLCWASDTGETPPSFSSAESPEASWSWGPGNEIHVFGLEALSLSHYSLGAGEHAVVQPDPQDCRRLDFAIVTEDWGEIELGKLEYADLCFGPGQCSPQYVYECSETPDGCPGD
ncbi:MAG: hypothetical protein R6X02_17075 [Enhygromyxa sp.]